MAICGSCGGYVGYGHKCGDPKNHDSKAFEESERQIDTALVTWFREHDSLARMAGMGPDQAYAYAKAHGFEG
jgi:hypothetical protein